jgi:AcrR family transcriptional regulator
MVKHQPSEVRRAQLFEAALQVLADKGYHATRVDDIASAAGLSKGALYHHFDSKQHLFLALVESMIDAFLEQMEGVLASTASARDGLERLFEASQRFYTEHAGLEIPFMDFFVLALREPEYREHFLRHYGAVANVFAKLIRRGIDEGELDPALDPDEAAWLLITAADGVTTIHAVLDQQERGSRVMLQTLELLLRGMSRKEVLS